MYFIYLVVIKIKENMQQDFEKALIPFDKNKEKDILDISEPSSFPSTGEKEAIRFLKLIGADNKKIGDWTRIIKDRDEVANSNVIIKYPDEYSFNRAFLGVYKAIKEIHQKSQVVLDIILKSFLLNNYNLDDLEYGNLDDEIRENFIKKHYLSSQDLIHMACYDINLLKTEPEFSRIENLFNQLQLKFSLSVTWESVTAIQEPSDNNEEVNLDLSSVVEEE
jgi:hypothetical protein